MHEFQHATAMARRPAEAAKDGGYKVVQIVGKTPIEPIKEYNDIVLKEMGGGMKTPSRCRAIKTIVQLIRS